MTERWWEDDDELLASLRDALHEMPAAIVDAGKAVFTWRTVDAELAALVHDSAAGRRELTTTRAERARVRELTFASPSMTVHVQVSEDALHGQVVPPRSGAVEVHHAAEVSATSAIDDEGWFSVSPVPAGPFRLLWTMTAGTKATTDWLSL